MFSLVVGTLNRTSELERLLKSLEKQTFKDFEVLIVDQNGDDRIVPVIERFDTLRIKHLRAPKGLSAARNVGLSEATGSFCAVPDDDCWYPPTLLDSINSWFESHAEMNVLLTSVVDESGALQSPRRRSLFACECDRNSIWHNGISINAFWRDSVTASVGDFDTQIGVGADSVFQSGEETDYLLRALELGHRVFFEPSFYVYHPSLRSVDRMLRQAYPFALGTGYVVRKHGYSVFRFAKDFLAYSFGGAVISTFRLEFRVAQVRFLRGWGQLVGYLSAPDAFPSTLSDSSQA